MLVFCFHGDLDLQSYKTANCCSILPVGSKRKARKSGLKGEKVADNR